MSVSLNTPLPENMSAPSASCVYSPSLTEIKRVMAWMKDSSISALMQKFFVSPMDSIVAIRAYPFDIIDAAGIFSESNPSGGAVGGVDLVLANQTVTYNGNPVTTFWMRNSTVMLDLGSYTFGSASSFSDYPAYATYDLYLPYIGYKKINQNEFWGRKLKIKYAVELPTGSVTAYIISTSYSDLDERLVDMENGTIGVEVPLAGRDANVQMANILTTGMHLLGGAAGIVGGVKGNPAAFLGGVSSIVGGITSGTTDPTIRKGGFGTGFSKWYGPQTCHLKISKSVFITPSSYGHDFGFPYGYTISLNSCSGFTKAGAVHVEGTGFSQATDEEKAEIERLLTSGVIF